MAKSFSLKIELGNDAMQYGEDIAQALHELAYEVEQNGRESGNIYDSNGNNVGTWKYGK